MLSKSLAITMLLSFFLLFGLGLPTSDEAKAPAPQNKVLDLTIKSCADFSASESHLNAAYHVVTKGYETIPTQKQPVGQLEGIETPEKMREFMTWYENGGMQEMAIAGEMCRAQMYMKAGEANMDVAEAAVYIFQVRDYTAEFFADKLSKQCTGKSLNK